MGVDPAPPIVKYPDKVKKKNSQRSPRWFLYTVLHDIYEIIVTLIRTNHVNRHHP